MKLLKVGIGLFAMTLFICASLAQMRPPDISSQWRGGWHVTQEMDPPNATCDNTGRWYPNNPFGGWPLIGVGWEVLSASYCDPVYFAEFGRNHWGLDFAVPEGTPVYATADGAVVWAFEDTQTGMGRTVKICTESGWCTTYMHLSAWYVNAGDHVVRGQIVGATGNTGLSTGPHLHYQIAMPDGQPVDPMPTLGLPLLPTPTPTP